MLQAIRPGIQAVIRNRSVQQFAFAVSCGVGAVFAVRSIDSVTSSVGSFKRARAITRADKAAKKAEAKKAKEAQAVVGEDSNGIQLTVPLSTEGPSLELVQPVATMATMSESDLDQAQQVVMDGAHYNELRAAAKSHGLDVGTHPTKEAFARAIVEFQVAHGSAEVPSETV